MSTSRFDHFLRTSGSLLVARAKTHPEQLDLLWSREDHNHDIECQRKLEKQTVRVACKRKVVDDMNERPPKSIARELRKHEDGGLLPCDVRAVRQSIIIPSTAETLLLLLRSPMVSLRL